MKKFDLVKDLVKSLNEGESRIVERFLVSFDDVKNQDSLKALKLFQELRICDVNSCEKEIMASIDSNYRFESFSKLVTRLKDKIYDTLILDSNIFRKDAYSEQYQKKIYLKKLTSVASIVHGRGNIPLAMELYEKVITGCKDFEIYNDLIENLSIVQQIKGISEGVEVYKNLTSQIVFYEKCRYEVNKAKHYFHELISHIGFTANPFEDKVLLKLRVDELEIALKETNSATLEYYLRYLQIQLAQWNSDYDQAVRYNFQLVELVKNNKAVYLKRALANVLNELSNNLQLTGKFSESLGTINEVLTLLPENSFNTAVAKEMLFFGFFYMGRVIEAELVINELLSNSYYNRSDFIKSKRTFFKANLLFFKKDHSAVHLLLQECRELENDKEGWNYGIRLLSIMNDIERGLYDISDNKIESLRKFISRAKGPVSERFILSQKILTVLVRCSFDFRKAYSQSKPLFISLENEHPWKIRTAELFPFEDWFKSKLSSEAEISPKMKDLFSSVN